MKTLLLTYSHHIIQSVFTALVAGIILSIPCASFLDIDYYKTALITWLKNIFEKHPFKQSSPLRHSFEKVFHTQHCPL